MPTNLGQTLLIPAKGASAVASLLGEVFKDLFTGAIDPVATPRTAEPGPGTWTVAGSRWKIVGGILKGGTQVSAPAWGSSRLKHTNGLARVAGRTLQAVVIPDDVGSPLAIGWATGTVADPTTDGHSWIVSGNGYIVATPGKQVSQGSMGRPMRPKEYVVTIVLRAQGALYFLSTADTDLNGGLDTTDPVGIPIYPLARLIWVEDADTTATLYPVISAKEAVDTGNPYPNGHWIPEVDVIDDTTWTADAALAYAYDRFTRADSASSLGTSDSGAAWTAVSGTWGISSNKGYLATRSARDTAWMEWGAADGIWRGKLTADGTTASTPVGFALRFQDTNNYIQFTINTTTQVLLRTWVAGGVGAVLITATVPTITTGSTHEVVIMMSGNKYRLYWDGSDVAAGWITDVNNRFIALTKHGLYANASTTARWDDLFFYPFTATLPARLQQGPGLTANVVGSTLASDAFTGADATNLNGRALDAGGVSWTAQSGAWSIDGNRATVTATQNERFLTIPAPAASYELAATITMPNPLTTVLAGFCYQYTNTADTLITRLLYGATSEIEMVEQTGGAGGAFNGVAHKIDLGSTRYVAGGSYALKVQYRADLATFGLIRIFLDGALIISHPPSKAFTGTLVGLFWGSSGALQQQTWWDGLTVKALS